MPRTCGLQHGAEPGHLWSVPRRRPENAHRCGQGLGRGRRNHPRSPEVNRSSRALLLCCALVTLGRAGYGRFGLWRRYSALIVGFVIVVSGMVNITPGLPFLPPIGDFPSQLFKPWMFGLFMLGVVLANPFAGPGASGGKRRFGALVDVLFLVSIAALLLAFLDQKETVDFRLFAPQEVEQAELSEEEAALAELMVSTPSPMTRCLIQTHPAPGFWLPFCQVSFSSCFTT